MFIEQKTKKQKQKKGEKKIIYAWEQQVPAISDQQNSKSHVT